MATTSTTATAASTVGQINHTEFVSQDATATTKFMTTVFGYTFQDMGNPASGPYYTFAAAAQNGGAVRPVSPNEPGPSVVPYITVEDLDKTVAKATQAGATVMVPKMPVPGMGWFAWLNCPGGVVLAAWQNDPNAPTPS